MIELDEDFDAASRELCPDGSCTGVLDEAGVCKVCGARGTPPLRPATAAADGGGDVAAPFDEMVDAGGVIAPSDSNAGADVKATGDTAFDDERQLCPDGSCIGVLDEAGRCKVCGRTIA
jgi:hypothetical protein